MKRILSLLLVLCLALGLAACGAKTPEEQWQAQYDSGVKQLSDGAFEQAIEAFSAAIELDPRRPEGYMGRADALIQAGGSEDLTAAQRDYDTALKLDPQNLELAQKMVDLCLKNGDWDQAERTLAELAEAQPSEELRQQAEAMQQELQAQRQTEAEKELLNISDEELLALANENAYDIFYLLRDFGTGGTLELNGGTVTVDGQDWYGISEEGIETIEDLDALWHQDFAASVPMPELTGIREIDGRLYSDCGGLGDDIRIVDMLLYSVEERDGTHVSLSGGVLLQDLEDERSGYTLIIAGAHPLSYELELEDGVWKCAGVEWGDFIPFSTLDEYFELIRQSGKANEALIQERRADLED